MTDRGPTPAQRRLLAAVEEVRAEVEADAGDGELLSTLLVSVGAGRVLDRLNVGVVADLERRGVFAGHGYRSTAAGLGDLLGWERFEARRHVTAAEAVCPRVGIDGAVLPARLPATAAAFTAGRAGLRHVEVIAKVLGTPAAGRLSPDVRAGAEAELAAKAAVYTPTELHTWGAALVDALDQDGAAPDDEPPPPVNELRLRRQRGAPGGTLAGRFDDPALFDSVAALLDAKAAPRCGDDDRPAAQRNAEALAEVCGYVLDHGDVPECGGHRPHLNVIVGLEDLETRARSAVLDFGGPLAPGSLRMLACDAAGVPIVMSGAGQPLDVGRATRTIPDGLRRAVAARDRGCAHPGCDRPPSWCEVHHVISWEHGGGTALHNDPDITRAASVTDYLFRRLALDFLRPETS